MDTRADTRIDYIRQKTVAFVKERTGGKELQIDEDIFATGYVNSLFVVQLITWIERTFNTSIESNELDIENFKTIEAISQLVQRKKLARTEE
jgi:methoxymalonate biosynthesis acyl carrier protein